MNKHGLVPGDQAYRKNTNSKWIPFLVNDTYMPLIEEFPEDYRANPFEIKIDPLSLPHDGQWCEYETYETKEIIGKYVADEEAFFEYDHGDPLPAFKVYFWRPLLIDWKPIESNHKKGTLAEMEGRDRFGNFYNAIGRYIREGVFEEIREIECCINVPDKPAGS